MAFDPHSQAHSAGASNVVVIGGANTDIYGVSDAPLIPRDSNPGRVRESPGGVARNIAENLARLSLTVHLITAFGGDSRARDLAGECRRAGIDVAASLTVAEWPGAVYLAIVDANGGLAVGLNDMRALEELTPSALATRQHILDAAEMIVVDTNVPPDTLVWLAEHARAPIVCDAVSAAKAVRVAPILARVHTLKASGLEAGVLLGEEVRNRDQALDAAKEFVSRGVTRAFVTSGAFGVGWAEGKHSGHVPAPAVAEVVNATGAGDAFAAGVAYATLQAWPADRAAAFGSACAALTLESGGTVSERMGVSSAMERMEAMSAPPQGTA